MFDDEEVNVDVEKKPIRVLMVDDQDAPVRELKRALEEAGKTTEFSFSFRYATDVKGYQRAVLDENDAFDVLVADLKLSVDQVDLEQGIEETVSWHLIHSPSTIVVVYSVFTSAGGDELATAIDTSVAAMRAGAACCIRKARGSTAKLVDTIIRELRARRDPSLIFDAKWWTDHSQELMRDYHGKAVAVLGDKVIASAVTIPELRTKLKEVDPETRKGILPRLILVPDFDDED